MAPTCPACGCTDAAHVHVHACRAALLDGDLDRAIELGLLTAAPCPRCARDCSSVLMHARDARLAALAARERFRARQNRLDRRERDRAAARAPITAPEHGSAPSPAAAAPSALPPAVAAALARAKARAGGTSQP